MYNTFKRIAWPKIAYTLLVAFASSIPEGAVVFHSQAICVHVHKVVQGTCSVFPIIVGFLTDRERECFTVQYKSHLGALE